MMAQDPSRRPGAVPARELGPTRNPAAEGGNRAQRSRPRGELGGHTVQDWEQGGSASRAGSTSRETPPPDKDLAQVEGKQVAVKPQGAGKSGVGMGTTQSGGSAAQESGGMGPGSGGDSKAPKSGRSVPPTPGGPGRQAGTPSGPAGSTYKTPGNNPRDPNAAEDPLVEAVTAKLGEMFARAVRQSVAEALEEVRGRDAGNAAESPHAYPAQERQPLAGGKDKETHAGLRGKKRGDVTESAEGAEPAAGPASKRPPRPKPGDAAGAGDKGLLYPPTAGQQPLKGRKATATPTGASASRKDGGGKLVHGRVMEEE